MNNLLGHYTNLSSLEYILHEMKLKFGSFNLTNDPYENRNLEFSIWGEDGITAYDSSLFINDGKLRKPFKLLCFSVSGKIDFFYERPRMWSQYADNHNGCCLILDKNKFDGKFSALKIKSKKSKSPVYYTLDKKKKKVSDLCEKLSGLGQDFHIHKITDCLYKSKRLFLYSKMYDWKQEKEYRYCIYANSDSDDIFIDISDSLKEILLGEKVSPLYRDMLYKWVKGMNIKVSYIGWENGFPYKIPLNDDYYKSRDIVEKHKIEASIPQIPD